METIRRMLDHVYWANGTLLNAIREPSNADPDILKLFRHVLIAEQVWITRLEGKSSAHLTLWEEGELSSLEALAQDNERRYTRYIDALEEQDLDRLIEYANQSGTKFRTSIRDILTHVALHGQYHRGQINRTIRQRSGTPVPLDYILYSRLNDKSKL